MPPRKKSKKSHTSKLLIISVSIYDIHTVGSPDRSSKINDGIADVDHYTADNGDIYARSRKQSRATGMMSL